MSRRALIVVVSLASVLGCAEESSAPPQPGKVASVGPLRGSSPGPIGGLRGGAWPRTTVKTEPPTITGDYDAAIATKEVRARLGAIKACCERGLRRNQALAGRFVLRWSLVADGTTRDVTVDDDTIGDAEVASCARALVSRWRFPLPPHGPVAVAFPISFATLEGP